MHLILFQSRCQQIDVIVTERKKDTTLHYILEFEFKTKFPEILPFSVKSNETVIRIKQRSDVEN